MYSLDKLILARLIKFSALYGTKKFITMFTRISTLSVFAPDATSARVQTRFYKIHYDILFMWSVPWFRWLVASLSSRRYRFDHRPAP